MKKIVKYSLIFCMVLSFCGCTANKNNPEKIRDLEFTVVPDAHLPETFLKTIEERKDRPFKVTYEREGWLYVAEGYGIQKGGGYSIQVKDFYEGENALFVDTMLLSPQEARAGQGTSFPYIVLKTEALDKNVVFQ